MPNFLQAQKSTPRQAKEANDSQEVTVHFNSKK